MSKANKVAKSSALPTNKPDIEQGLKSLQADSLHVNADLKRSRNSLYLHLSAAYLWWREAKEVPDFLDGEYNKLDRKFRSVSVEPNFIPLIWLVWGASGDMTNQYADRYSRALRAVHEEFEEHGGKYAKDGSVKLANFITLSGGVTKIAGYTHPDGDSSDSTGNGSNKSSGSAASKAANERLLQNAYDFANQSPFRKVEVVDGFATNEKDFSLLLVRSTSEGNTLITASDNTPLIESVLSETYRIQFDAMQTVIRPLLELIQTQCYPKHLKKMSAKLMESNKAEELSGKKLTAAPRVIYLNDEEKFMLSPVGADSGVVSLIKLNAPILKRCNQDVFLPFYQRVVLEKNFLQDFKTNMYGVSESSNFDEYGGDNSATHTLKLEHQNSPDKTVHLHFWPFYDSFLQPMNQVAVDPNYKHLPDWQANLPHAWFEKLAKECLCNWEETHGTQWTRKQHSAFQVDYKANRLIIHFDHLDGEFDCQQIVELDSKALTKNSTSAMYKTKDWVLAMKAISLLPVDGEISVAVNADALVLKFVTSDSGGAEHEIWIPAIDDKFERSSVPFIRYEPVTVVDESYKDVDPGDDDPEALADGWPEAGGGE